MNQIKGISRGLSWLAAVGMTGLMAACGGGGQSTILGAGSLAPVLVVPPTVTVVSPTPGATGVANNTKIITAGFSKAMDPATLNTASFTLVCPLSAGVSGGAVSYLASTRVATLSVPAALPVDTCTATVTTAAKDSTGVAMASNTTWQFSTSGVADTTPPTV
ncbi:MAG: Ig-like domain-containing protein, partial [Rhodoferax sp.]|nr:Ig-like domain-containing protein [Rhodoferax sp.]